MYRTTLCLRPLLLIACLGLVAGCDDGSGVGPGADGAIHPDADLNTNQNANQNPPVDAAVPEPDAAVQLDPFSFFVTSLAALRDLSGSQNGFGGDLSYGFTGPGAGLQGADELCAVIAERSMPGARVKQWRAFLSVTADENGDPVDARDRIGNGPWYDRLGRLLAPDLDDLLNPRPLGGDATIRDDFPNEDGVPNHQPDPTQPEVDNHDMLTGSDEYGQLYSASGTCRDWTAATGASSEGHPRVGHSWPRTGGPQPPGPPGGEMESWMSALDESGCAPGVNLVETGGPNPMENTVGSGGGYGGFYCFALTP
jgi:hypothetical protein